jgi:hypothetical protein
MGAARPSGSEAAAATPGRVVLALYRARRPRRGRPSRAPRATVQSTSVMATATEPGVRCCSTAWLCPPRVIIEGRRQLGARCRDGEGPLSAVPTANTGRSQPQRQLSAHAHAQRGRPRPKGRSRPGPPVVYLPDPGGGRERDFCVNVNSSVPASNTTIAKLLSSWAS